MTTYYKATRPDGTSFYDGKTKWEVGKITRRPKGSPNDFKVCGPSVIHASDAPAETLVGGSWPCRLFEVEGKSVAQEGHKHGFKQLKVVKELPSHLAFGPNGEEVATLIERCRLLTTDEAMRLAAARAATRDATRDAALDAALAAALGAVRGAAWTAVRGAAWTAVRGATLALLARDLINEEHFNILYGPWAEVIEGKQA